MKYFACSSFSTRTTPGSKLLTHMADLDTFLSAAKMLFPQTKVILVLTLSETWQKLVENLQMIFQMYFVEWKVLNFVSNSTKFVLKGPIGNTSILF